MLNLGAWNDICHELLHVSISRIRETIERNTLPGRIIMQKCVIAEFETREAARIALEALEISGYTIENVSVVASVDDPAAKHLAELPGQEKSFERRPSEEANEPDVEVAPTGTTPDSRDVGLGMILGGTIAAPLAIGTMVGPFMVIGPLVGMGIGAVVGGLLSSSTGSSDDDVGKTYEERVKEGSILVIVHDDDDIRLREANSTLQTIGPLSIQQFD